MKSLSLLSILVTALGFVIPVSAHHSFAMFDDEKEIAIAGTIVEFQWTNPHTWIQINVENDQGETVEWSVEASSPNGLARRGWKSTTFLPGDKVTLTINPMKSGAPAGSFISATFADGRVVTARQVPPPRQDSASGEL